MQKSIIAAAVIAVLVLGLLMASFVIVDSGYVGVVRTLGAVQPEPFAEGFHFKKPFMDKIEQIDIRLRKAESQATAASKDLQVVSTKVAVHARIVLRRDRRRGGPSRN